MTLEEVPAQVERMRARGGDGRGPAPTLEKIKAWVDWWKAELHLSHWGITVEFAPYHEMHDGQALARCRHERRVYAARMYVLEPSQLHPQAAGWSRHSTFDEAYECGIVHELLHLALSAWDPDEGTEEEVQHEQAVELLAATLVNVRRMAD